MSYLTDEVLTSLARIIRATDLHSRKLGRTTGLTTPQLVVMRAIQQSEDPTVTQLSRDVSLSQATVTNILNRLETNGLIRKQRGVKDKRQVYISLTEQGLELEARAPEPIQEEFVARFGALEPWEQHLIVSSLTRVASMMDAESIDAAPVLATDEHMR